MSLAGKRAGLDGERSGLFHQAIRIIKEMREATNGKYPRYAVWENVCFSGDTLITTSQGLKPIKDIKVGELVRTNDGTYQPVLATYLHKSKEVLRVKYQGGELVCTPNHPFLTEAGEYVPIGCMQSGSTIGFRCEQGNNHIGMPVAYAFGRWLADGSVVLRPDRKTHHRIFISCGYSKYEALKQELSKLPYRISENKMEWAVNFTFSSDEFGALTDTAGYGARNKQVPEWVFQLCAEERAEVLRGYLDGDGYSRTRKKHIECCFSSSSKKLIYGIARLIRDVYHVGCSIFFNKGKGKTAIQGRTVNANDYWSASFSPETGFNRHFRLSKYKDGFIWTSIKSIDDWDKTDVYNLSVGGNHTYEANGICVHNCGAFSSNGGNDFKAVLEAFIGVKEENVSLPTPEKGKWAKADVLLGDGWSLAYRTFDSQHWGVPQRRTRIYLVADFDGESAGEILFKSDGLSGYSEESCRAWQRIARGIEIGTGTAIGTIGANGLFFVNPQICVNPQGSSGLAITEGQTGTLVAQDHGNHPAVLEINFPVLNDQGGARMDVTDDITCTLRAQSKHPPCVIDEQLKSDAQLKFAGFCTEPSAKARSIGYEEEKSPTLRAGVVPAALSIENHPTDSRVKIAKDGKVQTLCGRAGTGGGNVPMIAEPDIKAFGICSQASHSMMSDNPHSGFYEARTSRTLDKSGGNSVCSNQGGIAVVETYDVRFTSEGTHNARGHCYKTDTCRCLDTGGESPETNHGGLAILAFSANQRDELRDLKDCVGAVQARPGMKQQTFVIQGSVPGRQDKNGPNGSGISEDVCFTLNTIDRHAIAMPSENVKPSKDTNKTVDGGNDANGDKADKADKANKDTTYATTVGSFMHAEEERANTLMARDYKDPQIINDKKGNNPAYIVRRLTPTECARLQAFPDWWCSNLETPNPSDEEIAFWKEVWNEWNSMNNKKPKTENQIRKWLAAPYSDAAEYALWGNGITATVAWFVLAGIVWGA